MTDFSKAVIRRGRSEEAGILSELAFRSKAYWGYDDAFMAACKEELALSESDVGGFLTYVLEESGQVRGFYRLSKIAEYEMELDYLFVDPGTIRQGYGQKLMHHAMQIAVEGGCRWIKIVGDPHAEAFYEAMGGVLVGEAPSGSISGRSLPVFRVDLPA